MDEGYGSNYITIEDEDGNEFELEQIATLAYKDSDYSLFLPADMSEEDPDYGYIILRIEEEDNEEVYCSVDDEDELVAVYDMFMEQLFDEDEDTDETGDVQVPPGATFVLILPCAWIFLSPYKPTSFIRDAIFPRGLQASRLPHRGEL